MITFDKCEFITRWIRDYAESASKNCLVVGISGGVDSSLVSVLCAKTGMQTKVVNLPIHQRDDLNELSKRHAVWLCNKYSNVEYVEIDLSNCYDALCGAFEGLDNSELSLANSKSRLRMIALYQLSCNSNGIVVGTGNKVEDFGVGFFTKYGDGGVDISPIADLYKTEVWECARELGVLQEILEAPPTDGLWSDGRTDEQQIGASYEELEWAMKNSHLSDSEVPISKKTAYLAYSKFHKANKHKMTPIPVCVIPNDV